MFERLLVLLDGSGLILSSAEFSPPDLSNQGTSIDIHCFEMPL